MRSIIIILVLSGIANLSFAQQTQEDYQREIQEYQQQRQEAVRVFLNPNRSVAERVRALEPYALITDEKLIQQFKEIVYNEQERERIRVAALRRLDLQVERDSRLFAYVGTILRNPETPKVLRREALDRFSRVSFSTFGMFGGKDEIISTFRELTKDPEQEYRLQGFSYLVQNNDDVAQQMLARGLENPEEALLPVKESISILSLAGSADYFPVIYKYLNKNQGDAVREEAIRALGRYSEARKDIIDILETERGESESLRLVAMGVLNASYPREFAEIVTPTLRNKETPASLFTYAVQAELYRRDNNNERSRKFQDNRYVPDEFDRLVLEYQNSESVQVSNLAQRYAKRLNFN
ncbi:MAG: hypothetical protein AAFY48_06420 [Bacteroidota bacterium]